METVQIRYPCPMCGAIDLHPSVSLRVTVLPTGAGFWQYQCAHCYREQTVQADASAIRLLRTTAAQITVVSDLDDPGSDAPAITEGDVAEAVRNLANPNFVGP